MPKFWVIGKEPAIMRTSMSASAKTASASLTSCQEKAFDMLSREGNIFLTGAAGTGKSFLLQRYLRGKPSDAFPIVASTGAAAVLVGGRTFHSFFGLGIMEGGLEATVMRAMKSQKLVRRLLSACCVVIDEVSMLSGTTLFAAEKIARAVRNVDQPWGGLRIIAVGDFAQLPPVTPGQQQKDWAFLHPIWKESGFQPALLSTVMRTSDVEFLEILNYVRAGIVNDRVTEFLNDRLLTADSGPIEGTRLYPHRQSADDYNFRRLQEIPRNERSFPTHYEGDARAVEAAKKSMPIPDVLVLKEGALVMMRKNDSSEDRLFVNGSLGHIREMSEEFLTVQLLDGAEIEVDKQKFSTLDGDGREVATAWNFPLTLAWATTIHKAQGTSLDSLIVDLASLWEPGQAYVALSRVRSAAGLHIERWQPQSIRAERLVTSLYDSLSEEMQSYVPRPLFTPIVSTESVSDDDADTHHYAKNSRQKAAARSSNLLELVRNRASLEEMASQTGFKADRLPLHLEKLLRQGEIISLQYLVEDVPSLGAIREAFAACGLTKLKPAYEHLREEVDYDTLRLVRCVLMAEEAA